MSFEAPNRYAIVVKHVAAHKEWAKDETLRGKVVDLAIQEANALDGGRWGRKSKNKEGTDLNTDVMCWKRSDGLLEYYDAVSGYDPETGHGGDATWDPTGPFKPGENGYWFSSGSVPPDGPEPPQPHSATAVTVDLAAVLKPLIDRIAALEAQHKPEPEPQPDALRVALRTADGHYLCAENGGGGDINATRQSVGGWETFTLEIL